MSKDAVKKSHYLRLKLNEQRLLLDLNYVEIILPLAALEAVAYQDDALEGMLNYHGQSLPVYALTKLISIPDSIITIDTPVILCKLSNALLGLIVTEVDEVVIFSEQKIQKNNLIKSTPYISGIVENKENSAWVLDLEKLISHHNAKQESLTL